jgi:hypothetical protein
MHLRARAVDLVEEEDRQRRAVAEDGTRLDPGPAVLAQVGVIDEVGGHEVDGALDTLVGAAERARSGTQERRLADAHVALKEHVATGEDGDGYEADDARLADDRFGNFRLEGKRARAPFLEIDRAGGTVGSYWFERHLELIGGEAVLPKACRVRVIARLMKAS